MSLEQNDEKACFFAYWYSFMEIKSWLENIGVGVVKNGSCDSKVCMYVKNELACLGVATLVLGLRTLKSAVIQEGKVILIIIGWAWSKMDEAW